MFTGLVQGQGRVTRSEAQRGDMQLTIRAELPTSGNADHKMAEGESISVNGVCLTAINIDRNEFSADVSSETLSATTLAELTTGRRVNLERALRMGDALGGHLVTGHVDAVSEIKAITADARSSRLVIGLPADLAAFVASKGSVCVDGVSLTVNTVGSDSFEVNIVPHTMAVTTFGDYQCGTRVNLEVDIIARYLERLAMGQQSSLRQILQTSKIDQDLLTKLGFIEKHS